MTTPRQFIVGNVQRGLANMRHDGLQISTDEGANWTAVPAGDAMVIHVDTADQADFDPDLEAEGNRQMATLKVSTAGAIVPAEGDWIQEAAPASRVWEVLGEPSIHSGQRIYRLGFQCFSPAPNAGPNRGQTR